MSYTQCPPLFLQLQCRAAMNSFPPSGDEIRDYLEEHDLSSRKVAAILHLAPDGSRVRAWIRGRHTITFSQWHTLRTLVEGASPVINQPGAQHGGSDSRQDDG